VHKRFSARRVVVADRPYHARHPSSPEHAEAIHEELKDSCSDSDSDDNENEDDYNDDDDGGGWENEDDHDAHNC